MAGNPTVQKSPFGVSRGIASALDLGSFDRIMPSNIDTLVTVFGGSGFIGRHTIRALAKRDFRIRVAVRRPDLAGHLQPLGRVGQIMPVQANVRYPDSVAAAVRDAQVVINLVGVLAESGAQTFNAVQAEGAAAIARAAAAQGARLVHVSAIGADENSESGYARSKAVGEKAVLAAVPSATIFRPSVVFGPEDQFTNRFAALARALPMLPLIGGGETKLQPVFVGDVAAAIADAVEGKARSASVYELGGPEELSMRQVLEYVLKTIERRRLLAPLPFGLARLQAMVLQFAPGPLNLTPDQVELLRNDNVVSQAARDAGLTLQGLGIAPASLEQIAPPISGASVARGSSAPRSLERVKVRARARSTQACRRSRATMQTAQSPGSTHSRAACARRSARQRTRSRSQPRRSSGCRRSSACSS